MDAFQQVKSPKRRYGLPCINPQFCDSQTCLRRVDKNSKHCEKDCTYRINYEVVFLSDCKSHACPYLTKDGGCIKFFQQGNRKYSPLFSHPKSLWKKGRDIVLRFHNSNQTCDHLEVLLARPLVWRARNMIKSNFLCRSAKQSSVVSHAFFLIARAFHMHESSLLTPIRVLLSQIHVLPLLY